MAEKSSLLASVRVRTTAAAVAVVAIALLVGAVAFVALVRDSLRDGLEAQAEQQLTSLVDQIERTGLPRSGTSDGDVDDGDDRDDPDDLVWQVIDDGGSVVASSSPLARALPVDDGDDVRLPEADHAYLVESDTARAGDRDYDVVVAVSLEEVDDSTDALSRPLLVGLPLLLLLVGSVTWLVVTRALAPVGRIRREVEQITGDRLDRRVPQPASRDEIHRLARTMNQMLERLQGSRDQQRQFVADASHELRSPLAGIRQTAEVARAHPGAMPEGELAEAVLEESVRMQRLVEQLLVLTRADEGAGRGRPQDVDVDDLTLTEAARVRRSGLVVDTTAVDAVRIRGDQVAIGQVVRNLVDNAARHAEGRVAIGVREGSGVVELVVEDDGYGIAGADRERIFDRFVRLDEARARDAGGSGLGLAIVREIVTAHEGTVTAGESVLGGARFVVRLPVRAV